MSDRFVYTLSGGPYNGKQIVGHDQLWRTDMSHHDPYAPHSSAKAIYGSRVLQIQCSPRLLHYWGSQPEDPSKARDPVFYS